MNLMTRSTVVVAGILSLLLLLTGCISNPRPSSEVGQVTRTFIKDYIHNPETIQFTNETVILRGYSPDCWDVYGVGTVMYEGSRRIFTYHVYVQEQEGELKCILKELTIGD
jgi:hypothetical protein